MGKRNMVNYVVWLLMISAYGQLRYADFITIAKEASEIKADISKRRFGVIVSNMAIQILL